MKTVSELIRQLQDVLDEYGDLPVYGEGPKGEEWKVCISTVHPFLPQSKAEAVCIDLEPEDEDHEC